MFLAIAAAFAANWSSPPAEVVRPGEFAIYTSWLHQQELSFAAKNGGPSCIEVTPVSGRVIGDASILHLANPNLLDGPVYKESFLIVGCNISAVQNVVILRLHAGGWRAVSEEPGATIASPVLQRDVSRDAVMAAMLGLPATCSATEKQTSYKVTDTQVIASDANRSVGSGWSERWEQGVCGLDRTVKVSFVRTANGGVDFSLSPAWPGAPGLRPAP